MLFNDGGRLIARLRAKLVENREDVARVVDKETVYAHALVQLNLRIVVFSELEPILVRNYPWVYCQLETMHLLYERRVAFSNHSLVPPPSRVHFQGVRFGDPLHVNRHGVDSLAY